MNNSTPPSALFAWLDTLRSSLDHLRNLAGMDGWWGGLLFALLLLHIVARIAAARSGRRPTYLLDLKDLQHEWASSKWYWRVFMPLLSMLVLGYLALAWAVHGAHVLLDLLVQLLLLVLRAVLWLWKWFLWLLGKLWWGLQWLWREVIDVTVVLVLKLIWHYVFVWTYRLLLWCLQRAFAGYSWNLWRAGLPHVLLAMLLIVAGTWVSSLASSFWPLACLVLPAYLILLGGAGTVLHQAAGGVGQPPWRKVLYRHPLTWGGGALLSVGLFLLLGAVPWPGLRLMLWGLSLDLALVVVPAALLLVFAFVAAAAMLPAYARATQGDVALLPFTRAAAWRFLKYLASTPYKALGIAIVSVLPLVLGVLLYAGITQATGLVGAQRSADDERAANLEAAWQTARANAKTLEAARNASGACGDAMAASVQRRMAGLSHGPDAWPQAITNASRGIADASVATIALAARKAKYMSDSADAATDVTKAKEVLDRFPAEGNTASSPAAERQLADSKRSTQQSLARDLALAHQQKLDSLQAAYSELLKEYPEGMSAELTANYEAEVVEMTARHSAELVERAASGASDLEDLDAALGTLSEAVRSDRSGGVEPSAGKDAAEEALALALERAQQIDVAWTLDAMEFEATISAVRWHNVRWIITGLLATLAMALFLALLWLPGWTYNVLKNAELYGYHEEGGTYAGQLVSSHRARDERQPVMGWIILMLLSVLLWFGALSQFGSTAWATIVNFAKANTQQVEAAPPPQTITAPVVTDTAAVELEPTDTLGMDPEEYSRQEAEAFLVGTWVGEMGGKPLRIVIERVADGRLEGYNVLGPTKRPIKGPYNTGPNLDACGLGYEAALAEPGDDRWDGVFRLQFLGAHGTNRDDDGLIVCDRSYLEYARASGEWRSNNGKLQRTFIVTKEGESTYSEMELRNMEYSEDEGLLTEPVSTEDVIREQSVNLSADEQVFTIVEEMPSFPGGEAELFKYLGRNLNYPQTARNDGVSGVVYLTFVVEKNGRLRDAKVLRGIGGGCDEEALRLVSSMPPWIPGRQRGKPVNVQYNLPIRFTLR